ncbi:TonB-dependent receptor [Cesiribacter sp. SM1]|uniref:SusC/RagA family TonB-linked outer membrane protein n=1 Tax=Cesiribacter sp. SM1 TaxID=2861196 RepID=UPI001CD2797D|nr:TonB-dependent receptor [Cesiribacter sp. SM1]
MKKGFTHWLSMFGLALAVCCLATAASAQHSAGLNLLKAEQGARQTHRAGALNMAAGLLPGNGLRAAAPAATGAFGGKFDVRSATNALERIVTGRVTDDTGEGLPGVSIRVKDTGVGTVTDMDGNYRLSIPDEYQQPVLVFSFVGYEDQEVAVGTQSVINLQMAEDVESLQELVVIGYQTVQKKDVTGAVGVVSPEAASRVTAASLAESIQGLAPGVTVRNSGAPGAGANIEIRGVSSFRNTSPLYVIDGMISDANPTINTNDIESVQILKDASAAAIYGSRAANGVVIITTKQGKEGPARVSFTAKYGVQQIPKRWDVMNREEFTAMQRMQYENSGLTPPPSLSDQFNPGVDTDWQEEVIRTGSLQDYNATISGGSSSGNYLVSGSYFTNEGVLIGNSFDRAALRINSQTEKGRVTFGENLLLTYSSQKAPWGGNPFFDMPQMLPVIPVQSDNYITAANPEGWGIGTTDAVTYAWNPVAVNNITTRSSNYSKLVGNAFVDVKILDALTYRFNAGAEASFDYSRFLQKRGEYRFNQPAAPSVVNEDRSRFTSLLFEHTLNFNKVFGLHNINGVVGYSQQATRRELTSGGRTNLQMFNGQYLTTINSATGESVSYGETPVDYKIRGFLGRLNYTLNEKYLITLSGRYDQDSRFASEYRSSFFPSVALGWRISDENFFQLPFISDLKLRGSWGKLGIVTVDSWDYIGFLNSNPRAIFGPDQDAFVGALQAQLANPDLRWEERISRNIGFDAGFLDNRITLSAEYYNSLSEDVLLNLPIAWYLGNLGGDPAVNAASIRNEGVELAATYRSGANPFKWDVSANLTTIKNTVEDVGNQGEGINYLQTGITRTQVGRSVGEWYLLQTNGLFRSQAEIDAYTNDEGELIQPFAQPGDVRYVDVNGDGTINQQDRTFRGSPWPTLQTGAQFNASYGAFNINMQLVGVFGQKVMNGVRQVLDSYQNTNFRRGIDPWSPENPDGDDPRLGVATDDPGLSDNARLESDRWLENASYVRMRNLEIGYQLPVGMAERFNIQNARLYISGQNLFTITKYSGLDPDVTGNADNAILERGFDRGNWPSSRVFSIGLQLGL